MGKNDLLGGSLWDNYSAQVAKRMDNPTHRGEITEAQAKALGAKLIVADWGAESCGDAVRLYWAVDMATNVIKLARFKSFGCGTAIASSDMMAELCMGKTVDEVVAITNLDVENALRDEADIPAIPPQKMHCSVMAYDVIKKAVSIFKNVDMSALEEEDMVCECARVTLSTIKDVIKINNLTTVEQITQYTKAGAFCKSCIRPGGHEKRAYYLEDILRDTRIEMDREKMHSKANTDNFQEMGFVQKIHAIDHLLDEMVRPVLLTDGGNMEVVDLKETDGEFEVYIQYEGACKTCPSAKTGTLSVIEKALQENIARNIKVITI